MPPLLMKAKRINQEERNVLGKLGAKQACCTNPLASAGMTQSHLYDRRLQEDRSEISQHLKALHRIVNDVARATDGHCIPKKLGLSQDKKGFCSGHPFDSVASSSIKGDKPLRCAIQLGIDNDK